MNKKISIVLAAALIVAGVPAASLPKRGLQAPRRRCLAVIRLASLTRTKGSPRTAAAKPRSKTPICVWSPLTMPI